MKNILFYLLISSLFFGCSKENSIPLDCNALKSALLADNFTATRLILNPLIESKKALPEEDRTAQMFAKNFDELIVDLNELCSEMEFTADGCAYSLPPNCKIEVQIEAETRRIGLFVLADGILKWKLN
ncbi:MAG: hypothetical protein ACPGVB_11755 [Chitinophagales bacterium]